LIKGRVGKLGINYRVETQQQAVADLSSREYLAMPTTRSISTKKLSSREIFQGTRENPRGFGRSRKGGGHSDDSRKCRNAREHVDCLEIVNDEAEQALL
jgi:hypothetical protein